ncbi:MAG: hypothetical protein K6U80_07955 [Firmicutes bacterium]|nr:hypothetical protein [Bacillota bacterium]
MKQNERLCEIWTLIEKKAFSPSQNAIRDWLCLFHRYLHKIWGNDEQWDKPIKDGGKFKSDAINDTDSKSLQSICCKPSRNAKMGFCYSIQQDCKKFDIDIFWRDISMQFGYDDGYLHEYRPFECKFKNVDLKKITEKDIKDVLLLRIKHPALHQHLRDGLNNFPHDVRLGLACINPFVLLYQIALQVCYTLNADIIDKEIEELSKVLYVNLSNPSISPGILFRIK